MHGVSTARNRLPTISTVLIPPLVLSRNSDCLLRVCQSLRVDSNTVVSRQSSVEVSSSGRRVSLRTATTSVSDHPYADILNSPILRCTSPVSQFCEGVCAVDPTE